MDFNEIAEIGAEIRANHDMRLVGLVVRFSEKEPNEYTSFGSVRGTDKTEGVIGEESFIDLSGGPFHVLLGRNGSGKSLLFRGLLDIDSKLPSYPSVSALYAVPSDSAYGQWDVLRRDLEDSSEFSDLVENLDEHGLMFNELVAHAMGLPAAETVCGALADYGQYDRTKNMMRAEALLNRFGLGAEATGLIGREEKRQFEDENPHFAQLNVESVDPRLFGPDYLMWMFGRIPGNEGTETLIDDLNRSISPMGHWFADASGPLLIGTAVTQFFGTITHVEYLGGRKIRLLADVPESGPLFEFLARVERDELSHRETEAEFRRRYIAGNTPILGFPYGLFQRVLVGNAVFVSTAILDCDSWIQPRAALGLMHVADVSPTHDALERAMDVIWERMMIHDAVDVARGDDGTVMLSLAIPAEVESFIGEVSASVRRCGVGIRELRLQFDRAQSELGWLEQRRRIDAIRRGVSLVQFVAAEDSGEMLTPAIEWMDDKTGSWNPFVHASLGQQQVIVLMLMLRHLCISRPSGSPHTIVISDEFDRNLHPSASKALMQEMQSTVEGHHGFSVICSTHSVPELGSADLAAVSRIYAIRDMEAFHYVSSGQIDLGAMQEILGVSALDALRTKRLHILVEGLHDEMIIGELLREQVPEVPDINIVMGNGVNSWGAIVANTLRFIDAPILMVYDKRNDALEDAWSEIVTKHRETGTAPAWKKTGLSLLNQELDGRKHRPQTGDHELTQILKILRHQVYGADRSLVSRVHLFGIQPEDIVDCLPISAFPKAAHHGNWRNARESFKKSPRRGGGEAFKNEMGIDGDSVRIGMARAGDAVHPELVRLIQYVRTILNQGN